MSIKCSNGQTYSPEQFDLLITDLQRFDDTQTVTLTWDSPTESELTCLNQKLYQSSYPLACSLKWFIQANNGQCIPFYSFNREQFKVENKVRIQQIHTQDVVIQSKEKTIRQAKLPLPTSSNRAQDTPLQQQQQQQQEQIKRIPQKKKVYRAPKESPQKIIEVSLIDLNELITRDALLNDAHIQAELQTFYDKTFLGRVNKPSLVDIWDNLVGHGAAYIQDKSRTLTGVKKDVMREIIKHYNQFLYGINPDNLPMVVDELGEVIQRFELCCHPDSQQYVLRFSESPATGKKNKFTLLLAPLPRDPGIEDFKELVGADLQPRMQETFTQLSQAKTQLEAQNAFKALLAIIASPDEQNILSMLEQFESALKQEQRLKGSHISLQIQHYQHLADMLVHGGAASVLCFLTCANALKHKGAIFPFLDNASCLQQWSTKSGLARLDALTKWSDTQWGDVKRIWWITLLQQHQAAGAPLNFNVLFDAFELFCLQVGANILPSTFPFQGIAHMQLALERLLYVLQHGPIKHIKHIRGLDLGPLGAWHAIRFEGFSFVLGGAEVNMGVTSSYALLQLTAHEKIFSYAIHDTKTFQLCMNLRERHIKFISEDQARYVDYADTKRFYYRYIARLTEEDAQSVDIDAYYQMAKRVERLSQNLTHVDNGPIFVFKGENDVISMESLSEPYSSGYICVKNKIGEPIALYFIDRNDLSTPRHCSFHLPQLKKFLQNAEYLSKSTHNIVELTLAQQDEMTAISGFSPEKNGHHQKLEDADKASLLYICAVAGSGRRACNQSTLPASELPEFLKALHELAKKMRVDASLLIETIHLHGLNAKTCPTLGELTTLIKSIPLPADISQDKKTYIKNMLTLTLDVVNDYGDETFEIFKNYRERLDKYRLKQRQFEERPPEEQQNTETIRAWMPLDYQTFITGLHRVYTRIQEAEQQLILIKLSPVLALISSSMHQDDVTHVLELMGALQKLHPILREMLIEQLRDMNLSTSQGLPTFDELKHLCQEMLEEFEGRDIYILRPPEGMYMLRPSDNTCPEENCYVWDMQHHQLNYNLSEENKPLEKKLLKAKEAGKLRGILEDSVKAVPSEQIWLHLRQQEFRQIESCFDSNQLIYPANYLSMDKPTLKSKIVPLITEHTPCRVGRQPMPESKVNLVDVFQRFAASPNFQNIRETTKPYFQIPLVGSLLQSQGEPVLRLLEQFRDLLKEEDVVEKEQELTILLDKIDEELVKLYKKIAKTPGAIGLIENLAVAANSERKRPQIKQFFKNPSLSVFAAPVFEELYSTPMRQQLKSLQLGNEPFEVFLLKQIQAGAEPQEPQRSSQVAAAYGERFNRLTLFFNALIRLRNTNSGDFQVCLDKLLHEQWYEKLDFQECSRLFVVLNQLSKVSVIDQLTWLFVAWEKAVKSPGGSQHLGKVLDGLQALVEYQEMLSEEELTKYIKESIEYNFNVKNTTAYRLGGEIKIQKMCNEFKLQPQDSLVLRQALSQVYAIILKSSTEVNANAFLDAIKEKTGSKLPDALPFLMHFLPNIKTQQDLDAYRNLLDKLPSDAMELNHWQIIFSAKATMGKLSLDDLSHIAIHLQRHRSQLASMCDVLFEGEPYPEKSLWMAALADSNPHCLREFQEAFDRHPYGQRNWEENRHSFDSKYVVAVISGIRRLSDNQALSAREQLDLKLQFDYLNALGTTQPLRPIGRNGQAIKINTVDGDLTEFQLNQCSRKTLKMLAQRLVEEFRALEQASPSSASLSDRGHRRLTLQLLAVMREHYYRSTGRVPNSTQMLTLIDALDRPERQLLGINTGEGKSITTALFASLLAAKGGTVCVPMPNRTLVSQDYDEKHNDRYYTGMGFSSGKIDDNSAQKDLSVLGIYYGTDADLSNYLSNAELKSWNLSIGVDGRTYPLFMVKDECDYSLDDRTQFKRAIPYEADQSAESSYAWIYEAANEFVKKKEFLCYQGAEAWGKDEDIVHFRADLDAIADAPKTGSDEKKRHVMFWESKLSDLIDDAMEAGKYKEGRDFFITHLNEKGRGLCYSIAVPFNKNGAPQWGGTFPRSQQACLHARLQRENPGIAYRFPIDSEQFCIASRGNMEFMRLFKIIIGLTGTPGASNELLEQQDKLGMCATSIPPHKEGIREELVPIFVKSADLEQAIVDAILYHTWYKYPLPMFVIRVLDRILSLYQSALKMIRSALGYAPLPEKKAQPILIITENKIAADALSTQLIDKIGKDRVQTISGVETNAMREEMLSLAGQANQVTVSTPLSGRGTDPDPKHEDGLFTIKVNFICTDRDERQIMGRSARKGQNGKYLAIYATDFPCSGWLSAMFGPTECERKKYLADKQAQLNQEIAVQRYYSQEVDEIQQIILSQFDAWMSALFGESGVNRDVILNGDDEQPITLQTFLFQQRGILIQQLSKHWQDLVDKLPANPYVMYDEKDQLITDHLDKALAEFKRNVLETVWRESEKNLKVMSDKYQHLNLSRTDKARLELLQQHDISAYIDYRKLSLYRERVNQQITFVPHEKNMARQLRLSSNAAWATAHYDHGLLRVEQHMQLLQEHVKIYLGLVYGKSGQLKCLDNQSESITKRLEPLVQALQAAKTFKARVPLQTTAFECIDFYDSMCVYFPELQTLTFSSAIEAIRREYMENLSGQFVEDLISQLSWSEDSASFYCGHIEYTQVMQATREIRASTKALQMVMQGKDAIKKKVAVQQLHQILVKHQQRLNSLWYYFPFGLYFFGYPDMRRVIAQALVQMDALVKCDQYSAEMQYIAQQTGQCEAYLTDFWTELEQLQVTDSNWPSIKAQLMEVSKRSNGFSVVDELLNHLSHTCPCFSFKATLTFEALQHLKAILGEKISKMKHITYANYHQIEFTTEEVALMEHTLAAMKDKLALKSLFQAKFMTKPNRLKNGLSLFRPVTSNAVQSLIERLVLIKQSIRQDHPGYDPLCSELFLSQKEAEISRCLKAVLGAEVNDGELIYNSMKLNVKAGHTGFQPYYEIYITSDDCQKIVLHGFDRDRRGEVLKDQLQAIHGALAQLRAEIAEQNGLLKEQLEHVSCSVSEKKPIFEASTSNVLAKKRWEKIKASTSSKTEISAPVTAVQTSTQSDRRPFWSGFRMSWSTASTPDSTVSETVEKIPPVSNENPSYLLGFLFGNKAKNKPKEQKEALSPSSTPKQVILPNPTVPLIEDKLAQLNTKKQMLEAKQAVLNEYLAQCPTNVMSRRFDTLADFLDFEYELRERAGIEALEEATDVETESVITEQKSEASDVSWISSCNADSIDDFSTHSTASIPPILQPAIF